MKLNDLRRSFRSVEAEHASMKRVRGFPCYRCNSTAVIKSSIGVALCPVCEEWLLSLGWVSSDGKDVPCGICDTDNAVNPDGAFWKKGVDLLCPTHAVSLQEGWLANEQDETGQCDQCTQPARKYMLDREDASSIPVWLCEGHFMQTPPGSTRSLPVQAIQKPKPIARRCVRCRTSKHVDDHMVSLGDGRLHAVRLCRECVEAEEPTMDDVFRAKKHEA